MKTLRYSLLFLVLFLPMAFGLSHKLLSWETQSSASIVVGFAQPNAMVGKMELVSFEGNQIGWPFPYYFECDDPRVTSKVEWLRLSGNVTVACFLSAIVTLSCSTLLKSRNAVAVQQCVEPKRSMR